MAIYTVKAEVLSWVTVEVEADSYEEALENVVVDGEVLSATAELSDCQYSDQQELQDEEDRYERKFNEN